MVHGKALIALAVVAVATAGAGGAAGAAGSAKTDIKAVQTLKVKINRYIQDGMRWDKDVYEVRSGGTLHIVNNAPNEGPHTLTIVAPKDEPRTPPAILDCKICSKLAKAHGANPESEDPPKFPYLEDGVGQATVPNVDKAGDSALLADKKGKAIDLKVTAKKGAKLRFMCLIHPWMQGEVRVG